MSDSTNVACSPRHGTESTAWCGPPCCCRTGQCKSSPLNVATKLEHTFYLVTRCLLGPMSKSSKRNQFVMVLLVLKYSKRKRLKRKVGSSELGFVASALRAFGQEGTSRRDGIFSRGLLSGGTRQWPRFSLERSRVFKWTSPDSTESVDSAGVMSRRVNGDPEGALVGSLREEQQPPCSLLATWGCLEAAHERG